MHFSYPIDAFKVYDHGMELRSLRYFVAVAECSGFSPAAERVGISQPALSRQISALETELGVRLFDRVGRRTLLTAAGDDMLVRARALLHDAEAIRHRAEELAGGFRGRVTPRGHAAVGRKLCCRVSSALPHLNAERGNYAP